MNELLNALGSFAVAAQVLFVVAIAFGAYLLGFGMNQAQRSAVALGICSRNGGAMFVAFRSLSGTGPKCAGDDFAGSSGSGNCVVVISPLFCLKG